MFIWNRPIGSLALCLSMAACQASHKPEGETMPSQESRSEKAEDEASEGVVGPDEAFFAAHYLENVFHYSRDNASPIIDPESGWIVGPSSVSAFDYQANFTEQRLRIMSYSLFMQGDQDKDGSLTETEFAGLKLDPWTLGVDGETLSHSYDLAFFERVAGSDERLQFEECTEFLRDLGPLLKAELDRIPPQDQRRQLLQAWEKVLGRYDTDQNGSLNLQEQRELRKDRALLINRLTGE